MKPCDCKDIFDVINELNEAGITMNNYGIQVAPLSVLIHTSELTLRLPQSLFKRMAEWYLEDQEKEK
jgi:hypothetical protein